MYLHLKKEFRFEASHQLPTHDGKCARLHGHSWVLNVWSAGMVQTEPGPKEGMVQDYSDIKTIVGPIVEMLDHRHLGTGNVGPDFEYELEPDELLQELNFPHVPTSENILIWIATQLSARNPEFNWQCLELQETCTSAARLYAVDWARFNRKQEVTGV